MIKLLAISGSLRTKSYNSALLRAATYLAPAGVSVEIAPIQDIPLYNGDTEDVTGLPDAVRNLKNALRHADGLLLATPEYNNSIPGVMKNALDWVSRPATDIPAVFEGLPVAIIGASPGGFGTVLTQAAWLPVLRALGMRAWFGDRLLVSRAGHVFDTQMTLTDDAIREQLREFVARFAEFAASVPRRFTH